MKFLMKVPIFLMILGIFPSASLVFAENQKLFVHISAKNIMDQMIGAVKSDTSKFGQR